MKKLFVLFVIAASLLAPLAAQAAPSLAMAEGKRYIVYSELGQERATALVARLEGLFGLYNDVFHFEEAALQSRLVVREFADRAGFDAYVQQAAGLTKEDFVYLHYTAPARRELVTFQKEEPEFGASLAHQAFVQFLKAFVRNPPLWMRDGFAVYFETASWDEKAGILRFPENLAWLATVKGLEANGSILALDRFLRLGPEESRAALDVFYPEAWAFVSFLAQSPDKEHNRLLWDAISALSADGSLESNQETVSSLFDSWYGLTALGQSFSGYLASLKTFPELVAAGEGAYGAKDWAAARDFFNKAGVLNPSSFVPPYYLGLVAYAEGDFAQAEFQYKAALKLGCDEGIANYALGVNAFALGRNEDAAAYVGLAEQASPERYAQKAADLRKRMGL